MRLRGWAVLLCGLAALHAVNAQDASDRAHTVAEAATLIDADVGDRHLVMLGEMHGTAEIPAIAGELVGRWASEHRQPVLLGLEAASTDQARVDHYLASGGTAADRADLLAGEHWTEPMHDGRDSVAMAMLIERMRALRAAGADVSIAMFDPSGDGERNARMAASLRGAIAAHPGARVLVLTGNVHAMTGEPPEMFSDGKPYKLPMTMARHLADLHPVSIDFGAIQGDFWACQDTCGRHPVIQRRPPIAEPSLERNDPGATWDYRMILPRFSASEPAAAHGDAGT